MAAGGRGTSSSFNLAAPAVRLLALFPLLLCLLCTVLDVRKVPEVLNESYILDADAARNTANTGEHRRKPDQEVGWSTPVPLTPDLELPSQLPRGPKIAFATTTAATLDTIKVWIRYHQSLGVATFYVFTNGQVNHASAKAELERFSSVKVFPNDEKLKHMTAHSRSWNESWLSAFFNKPCNHELFVMQSLNMEVAIKQARVDEVEWLLHMDTDELMYPGGTAEYNLQQYLASVSKSVDTIIFPNYEGLAERDDVQDPFVEVNLFKRNFAHVTSEPFYKNYKLVSKGNPNYFTAYGNGKSAVRVQPKIRPNGAHRWYIYGRRPRETTSDNCAVLHYIYNRYEDLKGRRDRCDCAPTEEDVKRCFILPFDRAAFIASSLKSDPELREYFRDHLVWTNQKVVTELVKAGLFVRLYAPQVMMKTYRQLPDFGLSLAKPGETKETIMDSYVIPS